jgi:aminoglycoside 6'-N-acetyltransferase I
MTAWRIRTARISDNNELAAMRRLLWPESSFEEHLRELQSGLPAVNFVAVGEHESLIGFLEAGLRSHADGCDPSHSVGYVEGWFVREEFRRRGIGTALMGAAEDWARAQGCLEMASDALIDNEVSHRGHEALGFEVVDRCVHFRKRL